MLRKLPSTVMLASLIALAQAGPGIKTADPKANRAVRSLLQRLRDGVGKQMVSGQTDLPDAQWVGDNTGRLPVILGLDFLGTPKSSRGDTSNTQDAINWAKKQHGIVAYQWHWISPAAPGTKDRGFYSKATTFDLKVAMDDPKSEGYRSLLADIDDVATELKKMEKAGVPVLFRPLHEAQGRWFWWGDKGPEPCVALYKLIFHRFTDFHHLHNLAWVWNVYPASQNKGNPADWYPGNDLVDIVATDYLQSRQDYLDLVQLTGGTKIVGIAETMNPPDPDKSIADGARWAYWVTWARRDWNKNSAPDVKSAMGNSHTVSLPKDQ